ncbi:MAG: hypothetical protein U1F52_05020 [Burkholderiales bacterium]
MDLRHGASLETRLSFGANDLAEPRGDVTLRFTLGGDRFVPSAPSRPT